MTNRIALIISLILFSNFIFGQSDEPEKHPIDIKMEKCLSIDSNQTTTGMMQCQATARDEWEVEINKYYNLLYNVLPSEEKEKLRLAQQFWLQYRDKELDFSGTSTLR